MKRALLASLLLLVATTPALPLANRAGVAADAPAADDIFIYHVKPGENLPEIARKWFADPENWRALQALNRIADPLHVAAGTPLRVQRAWLRVRPLVARVIAFRGDVALLRDGSGVAVRLGSAVHEGDHVQTGRNGFATLQLPDGSLASLPSASRIEVARLRQVPMSNEVDRRFALTVGHVDAHVTPMRNPRSTFLVQTPVAVAAVRGTRFRVSYVPAGRRASVEVSEGKVEVTRSDGSERVLLLPGAGAVVTPAQLTPAVALLAAPVIDPEGAVQRGQLVEFHLQPVPGASRYVGEIATDAAFVDRIARIESDRPLLQFSNIIGGQLYLRAAAVDGYGLIGQMAALGFTRVPLATAARPPVAPVNRDDIMISGMPGVDGWWSPASRAGISAASAALAGIDAIAPEGTAAMSDEAAATAMLAEEAGLQPLSAPAAAGGFPLMAQAANGFGGYGAGGGWSGGSGGIPSGGSGGGTPAGGVQPDPDAPGVPGQPDGTPGGAAPSVAPPGAPIPEPALWALLISGFGLIGWALRRRSRQRRHA